MRRRRRKESMAADASGSRDQPSESIASTVTEKKIVSYDAYGKPVGKDSTTFSTRLGELCRTHLPINYKHWGKVSPAKKEEVLDLLAQEYEIPNELRGQLKKNMAADMKSYKGELRDFARKHKTLAERLANPPKGVHLEEWSEFVQRLEDPEYIQICEKNKANRSHLKSIHTTGRWGYSRIAEDMRAASEGKEPNSRDEVWIKGNTKKDGSVPTGIQPQMDQIKELISSPNPPPKQPISQDALSKVFGIDSHGRTRGIGSTISYSAVISSAAALLKLRETQMECKSVREEMKEVKSIMYRMDDKINYLTDMMTTQFQSSQQVGTSNTQVLCQRGRRRRRSPSPLAPRHHRRQHSPSSPPAPSERRRSPSPPLVPPQRRGSPFLPHVPRQRRSQRWPSPPPSPPQR